MTIQAILFKNGLARLVLAAALLVLGAVGVRAQTPGDTDPTFGPGLAGVTNRLVSTIGTGVGEVNAVAPLPDGRVLVGGFFIEAGGQPRIGIARLNADGSADLTFGTGQGSVSGVAGTLGVRAITVQSDGKILVGGQFGSISGVARSCIARLNADGTVDTSFGNGLAGVTGPNPFVDSIVVQPDGKILIGGNFTAVNGAARIGITRLNANGTLDPTFAVSFEANVFVSGVALQTNGRILIGGNFITVNGTARGRVARLNADGTLDATFGNGQAGANSIVDGVALQSDGKVIVFGGFNRMNGTLRQSIARLNADGTLDTTFGTTVSLSSAAPQSVVLQPDGKVIVGGLFNQIGDVTANSLVRLTTTGALDPGFPQVFPDFGPIVFALALQSDGRILVGGRFTFIGNVARGQLARLNVNGTVDATFVPNLGRPGLVNDIARQPDGKMLVTGVFNAVNGVARDGIARLNADGTTDATFGAGQSGLSGGIGRVMALQPDGKVLVGGRFTQINGAARGGVARLNADGTLDPTFGSGLAGTFEVSANSGVYAVLPLPNGQIMVGGIFSTFNGAPASGIVRLNADGSRDSSFSPSLTSPPIVRSIIRQPDGRLLVGGRIGFTPIGMVRLNTDGTMDETFSPVVINFGFGATVDGIAAPILLPDGKIFISGNFTLVNSVTRNGVARLNADGTLDAGFASDGAGVNGNVTRSLRQPDGKIIIVGEFTSFAGQARPKMARLNTDGSLEPTFGDGLSGPAEAFAGSLPTIFSVALQPDGKLVVGGQFNYFNGVFHCGIARLENTVSCPTISVEPANPTLPAATVGANYSGVSFLGSGGTGPYGLTLTGGSLPPGMNFSSGAVVGTPTAAGTFNFTVTATETTSGCFGSREYTLTVNPAACPTITVEPTNPTLPAAMVGVNYSGVSFLGSGGTGPYGLTLTGGSLPPGMNFSSGAVVGTPTAAGTFNFTVTATETFSGCFGSREYTLTVNPAAVGTPVLVNGQVNLTITGQSLEAATCSGYASDLVLTGTLTNTGATTITDPFFEVIELQASSGVPTALPYRLLTASGASCGSGGLVGSQQTVGAPGFVLNPGQSVPVTFRLALPTMGRLRFFVNVRGVLPVISQRLQAAAKRRVRVLSGLEVVAISEKSWRNR